MAHRPIFGPPSFGGGCRGGEGCGVLERDGWGPYRRFEDASHQTCVAHLLRRCSELIADSVAGQAKVPHAVRRLLLDAIALRDQHADLLSLPAGVARLALGAGRDQRPAPSADHDTRQLAASRAELRSRLDKLLAGSPTPDPNRKLLAHLRNESEHLLTFHEQPGVQATSWRAEQASRPAVVNRKHWGGNRTWHGADSQQVLMSVIRTARQQHADAVALLRDQQQQPVPTVTPVLKLPTREPPAPAQTPQPARGQ